MVDGYLYHRLNPIGLTCIFRVDA